jgi:hypothetical protein
MTWRIRAVQCLMLLFDSSSGFSEDLRGPADRLDHSIISPACYLGQMEELAAFRR